LPVLLAGNPTNYAKATKLSTVEALAGALYIAGFREEAEMLLSMFVWGHTFLELNADLLAEYSGAKDSTEIVEMQSKFLGKKAE
jgi:pre-rRNA-processing protein TSR3